MIWFKKKSIYGIRRGNFDKKYIQNRIIKVLEVFARKESALILKVIDPAFDEAEKRKEKIKRLKEEIILERNRAADATEKAFRFEQELDQLKRKLH